jgi:hypothetical protein
MRTTAPLFPLLTLFTLPLALLCASAGAANQAPPGPTAQPAPQTSAHSHAQSPAPSSAPAPGTTSTTAGPAQGLTVVRDAETGRLRAPTPDEMRALQRRGPSPPAAPPQPTMVTGPDGRRHVQLGERGMVYSVVKRGPDGKLDQQCVHGADAAGRVLAQPAPDNSGSDQEARHDHR